MVVGPYADEDLAHLGQIHGPGRDVPRRARTFVAVMAGEVVGAGTLLWSNRHPDLVAAVIDVDGSARRSGVGSTLLRYLEREADHPLMLNVPRTVGATRFLEGAGFVIAVSSTTCRVPVSEALAALQGGAASAHPTALIEVVDGISGEVTELYEKIYRDRHTWAGRYTPPSDAPWIGFVGPALSFPGAIQLARTDGVPVCVASLHAGHFAKGAEAFLAPTSVVRGDLQQRTTLLARVLSSVLGAALSAGVTTINVEYDTPYDDLSALVSRWPVTDRFEQDVWLRP